MTTALDVVKGSLRLLQVLGEDTVLTAEESNDALEALNYLLDSWSNDSLAIYQVVQETFNLTVGKNPHTWGVGGDFNSARPTRILSAKIRVAGGSDFDLPILAYDDYAAVILKSLSSTYPQYLWDDRTYPLTNIYLYPVPGTTGPLVTYSEKPLTQLSTLSTVISLPPGYLRALKYNLAVELAPEFQVSAGSEVIQIADNSLQAIKRTNRRAVTLQVDPAFTPGRYGRRNILWSGSL